MTSSRDRLLRVLPLVLRLGLGAVFLYAACSKLRQPWLLFAMAIDAYGVLPQWAVLAVARTLPWLELLIGVLLMAGLWRRVSATISSVLLLVFFAFMLRSYFKGMEIDCGCFGLGETISAKTLARDAALVLCSLALTATSMRRVRHPAR